MAILTFCLPTDNKDLFDVPTFFNFPVEEIENLWSAVIDRKWQVLNLQTLNKTILISKNT